MTSSVPENLGVRPSAVRQWDRNNDAMAALINCSEGGELLGGDYKQKVTGTEEDGANISPRLCQSTWCIPF